MRHFMRQTDLVTNLTNWVSSIYIYGLCTPNVLKDTCVYWGCI